MRTMIEIWATLGPSSYGKIKELEDAGVSLFRLNLSHTRIEQLEYLISFIKDKTDIPLCLDTDSGKYHEEMFGGGLTQHDIDSLKFTTEYVALSFAESANSVKYIKELCPNSKIISKIESADGVVNLHEIADNSDKIMIDRGDLSGSFAIERIPAIQKRIIRDCSEVYVATNVMESMMSSTIPSVGEVNDVYNILLDGAAGIVLAGETAIGKYPVETVAMIGRIINEYGKTR